MRINSLRSLLAGLTLALLLVACGDQATPAAPESLAPVTPGVVELPVLAATPTPLVVATTNPTTTTAAAPSPAPTEVQAAAGQQDLPIAPPPTFLPQFKPEELPKLNGVPVIPAINQPSAARQPQVAAKANYGLSGAPRVGLQIGHYQIDQLPDELASLRSQSGGSGGGVREVDFNQDIAQRVAALLKAKGATVDVLPATVPAAYTADVFIAIHADASTSGSPSGYKIARSRFSAIPVTDDALVDALYRTYGQATGMPTDSGITRNMTGYYAFNNRRRLYAISNVTPAAIIETGFLTSAGDRAYMMSHQDAIAKGIANGIWEFISQRPPLDQREKPVTRITALEVAQDHTPLYNEAGALVAYASKGQQFEFFEDSGQNYAVFVPILNQRVMIPKTAVTRAQVPR